MHTLEENAVINGEMFDIWTDMHGSNTNVTI